MTEPGTLLGGRYELDQIIGRGGMAEVWRARDIRLSRDVAVKRLRVDLASDPTFQERFRREAQAAGRLNHPNIVAVYDTGEELDTKSDVRVPFIVMELVEGVTLRDVLRDGRKILPERALEFTAGVLDALAYSHTSGIIHRDIKPANVMLTPGGAVKVMDFGIARAVADTSATMTQTAAVIGTAQYLSPEQARGERVDNRSDLYSVGCLMYELLTSQPPFTGDSPVSVAYQHVREAPVPPSQIDSEITPAMDAIVLKSLAKDPVQRYQDAREMRDDIQRALNNQPVHAVAPVAEAAQTAVLAPTAAGARRAEPLPVEPDLDEDPEEEEPKKKRTLAIWLSVLGVLLVAGIGIAAYMILNPPEPEVETVAVPNVVEMTQAEAQSALTEVNLEYKIEQVSSADVEVGSVVSQDPPAGELVELQSVVTLGISSGPDSAVVPDLIGMTEEEADKALEDAGFTGKIKFEPDDPETEPKDAEKGTVTEVDPDAGSEVAPDQEITVKIATGQSMVPTLRGLTLAEAQAEAQEAGFEVEEVYQETNEQQAGLVFDQSPTPNQAEDRSTKIRITIAEPEPTPTPTETETESEEPELPESEVASEEP